MHFDSPALAVLAVCSLRVFLGFTYNRPVLHIRRLDGSNAKQQQSPINSCTQ